MHKHKSPFRSENNKYFTKQLFYETWQNLAIDSRQIEPVFTLYQDREGLINFGKKYVELADPTGVKITDQLLNGDYTHWTVMNNCKWFIAAKELWDKELDARLKAEAMDNLKEIMKEGMPAQRLAASKYIANQEYRKTQSNRGRPSKQEVEKETKKMAEEERTILEDYNRIRLVKG